MSLAAIRLLTQPVAGRGGARGSIQASIPAPSTLDNSLDRKDRLVVRCETTSATGHSCGWLDLDGLRTALLVPLL